ncbi:MAG TPA: UvrD-helicase domain-containing protein [Kiritimatiellia bacterium]|nr:UvrD-helicase domain-containing protein [Kiritimatiellia bacterium]
MSAPAPIRNAALAASAGTGKTFALSSRYLALLAAGADPAAIVALTFTRKAAGEILARILTRLARAAASEEGNRGLSRELAAAQLAGFADPAAAQAALRRLVQALPRLRIGTLDSFFLQILRPFRLEAGIGAELAIAPQTDDPEENLILQSLLERAALSAEERRELMETFKLATFGEEKKSVYGSIARLVQNQYELYQRAPDRSAWGDPARIWEDGAALLGPPAAPDWSAVFAALDAQAGALRTAGDRKAWDKFAAMLRGVENGGDYEFGAKLNDRLYAAYVAPGGDRASIPFGRGAIALRPETQAALAAAFAYIRHAALARQIVRTQGLYRLLAAYGREHRAHVARTGQLSFNDIAQLLAPASGPIPARRRALLESRLDARYLHWLLDEFQDTSLVQWAVIENLLDEVVQNPDGDRTLFYVGDVKQAIYEWRSGDPRLFRRILAKYNRPGRPPAIEEAAPLVRSWRSSPVVLDAVNAVFGRLPALPLPDDEELAADWRAIAARWAAEWQPHAAAPKNETLAGHVALHVLPRPKPDEEGPTPIARAADLVAELRRSIPDFDRRSIALLARGNADGLALLDALAERGIRAVWAGNSPLLDNALIPAILSYAKLTEHPGDGFARRHVEMSPLAGRVSLAPAALAAQARLIREQGYSGFAARLAAALDLSAAPFEQNRLRTLVAVAAEFDRQPGGNALQFVACVQAQEIPAEETGSNVQILTMHKAKGLEFDVVVLPALGDKGITSMGKPALLVRERDGHDPIPPVDWILSAPETDVIDAEPPLAAQRTAHRHGKALEELRLLYVAMTRAKRALHLITVAPAASSTTLRLDNVLQNALAPGASPDPAQPVWERGSADWWKQETGGGQPAASPGPSLRFGDLPSAPAEKPLEARVASREHAGGAGADGRAFRPEGAEARDLGTRAHALFERIAWLAPGEIPEFPDAAPADVRLVADALKNPRLHALFEKPAGDVELMREQAFEAVLDGRWLSGKIDRLHLERGAAGKPIRARVLDFKTDRAPDPERHRAQMEDYRQAVSMLFALPPAQIACTLLFARTGDAVEV